MSKIAIAGATTGTGTFTLASPATDTDRVLTLPDEAGTVLTTAGVPASAMPAGSVLQVVQTVKSDSWSTATKGTYSPVTGLSATLTPASANSKILITAHVTSITLNNCIPMFHIYRNGTKVTPDGVNTTLTPNNAYALFASGTAGGAGMSMTMGFEFLDSPSSTSSLTYQIYASTNTTAVVTLYVNPTTSSGGGVPGGNSSITLMEIAG